MKPLRTTVIQAAPIALRRDQASQALGISVSLFESLVRRGRMPKPRLLADKSVGWLYAELQRCAEALPVSDLPPGPGRRRQAPATPAEFSSPREPAVPAPHSTG
ncbi:MAG: AlpA family phage regulatory protein [Burkholderiaceae bacterium]|nr:AlpA family phage regulatory protein [Burkholderiaceae bacterium]